MLDIFQCGILKEDKGSFFTFGGGSRGNTQNQVIPLICIFIILSTFM